MTLVTVFSVTKGQEIKYGPGIDIVTPISKDLGRTSGAGYGLSLRGQIGFIDKFSIMGTIGYHLFSKETNTRVGMLPAQFGFKYALNDSEIAKVYMSLEAGIHSLRIKNELSEISSSSSFSYAPGLGVQILNIDLSTRLQLMDKFLGATSTNYFNIRLGYTFGI